MKTILAMILLAGLLGLSANTSKATITLRKIEGYREAKWGMSPEEVQRSFPSQHFSPLEKAPRFSHDYLGELLITGDLVSTFSFADTILEKDTSFNFYFYRNQLYQVQLTLSPSFDYGHFRRFWEAIEQKYGSIEPHREPPPRSIHRAYWEDRGKNAIFLRYMDGLELSIIYTSGSMRKKINEELKKKEKQRELRELEDIAKFI